VNKPTPGSPTAGKQEVEQRREQLPSEVVMAALEAARSGLGDDFISCFSDDLDFWFPGTTPISGRRQGLPAFKEYLGQVASYLSEMIVVELTNVVVTGEWVFTEGTGHGVTKKGLDYDNDYCLVWQVRDGKVIRFVEYCDTELVSTVLCA
jgi:ketosteroid isomerase-like protein